MTNLVLRVVTTSSTSQVFTNFVYLCETDYTNLLTTPGLNEEHLRDAQANGLKVTVGNGQNVYTACISTTIEQGTIALNMKQRCYLKFELDKLVQVTAFRRPKDKYVLSAISFTVGDLVRSKLPKPAVIDCEELGDKVSEVFGHQVLRVGQVIAHDQNGVRLELVVATVSYSYHQNQENQTLNGSSSITRLFQDGEQGLLLSSTELSFRKNQNATFRLSGNQIHRPVNQMLGVNFEKLGIGGLDKEFGTIFRRAFASRIFSHSVIEKTGSQHVRGMMLYGPPGCGKTLIARQISKVLQGGDEEDRREPRIVNGPEILSKFVGEAEKNIRELFAEAEQEQAAAGSDSGLHVIIFDEIDSICKQRGSSRGGTGVNDSVVNQLLSKIDGVDALHNILVIGMTNRLDMIDDALLRPGRFEVQIEIGLPDEVGRTQILTIHTNSMKENGLLAADVSIPLLAAETKNYSGAELEGVVRAATSYALQRQIDYDNLSKPINEDEIRVEASDFELALRDVQPAYGVKEDELSICYRGGMFSYGESFKRVTDTFMKLANQVKTSERTSLLSLLLSGQNGSGKTALIAKIACESGFPLVKMISADSFIGMDANAKCSRINTIFEDAYRSPLSMIIMDDIERLIEYVQIGPHFSNLVLQALLVLVNKPPPKLGRKLMVVGTTSLPHLMDEFGFSKVFNVTLDIPQLETPEQIREVISQAILWERSNQDDDSANQQSSQGVALSATETQEIEFIAQHCHKPIGIKRLLLVLSMARQNNAQISCSRFMECQLSTS